MTWRALRARPPHTGRRSSTQWTTRRSREYHPELWAEVLRRILVEHEPRAVLIPATGRGRDYGPRAAGELELGMTADCVGVDIAKAGRLLQQKPAYGGNIVSVILGATTPQLATVLPRMYEPLEPRDFNTEIHRLDIGPLPEPKVRLVERTGGRSSFDLDEKDVVVGVGPDIDPALVELVEQAGAAVAGTREACEAGLIPRTRQVGLLGRPIAPRPLRRNRCRRRPRALGRHGQGTRDRDHRRPGRGRRRDARGRPARSASDPP